MTTYGQAGFYWESYSKQGYLGSSFAEILLCFCFKGVCKTTQPRDEVTTLGRMQLLVYSHVCKGCSSFLRSPELPLRRCCFSCSYSANVNGYSPNCLGAIGPQDRHRSIAVATALHCAHGGSPRGGTLSPTAAAAPAPKRSSLAAACLHGTNIRSMHAEQAPTVQPRGPGSLLPPLP